MSGLKKGLILSTNFTKTVIREKYYSSAGKNEEERPNSDSAKNDTKRYFQLLLLDIIDFPLSSRHMKVQRSINGMRKKQWGEAYKYMRKYTFSKDPSDFKLFTALCRWISLTNIDEEDETEDNPISSVA